MMRNTRAVFGFAALIAPLAVVVLILQIEPSLLGGDSQMSPQDARKTAFTLDCSANARPISPLIYGIGGSDNPWLTGTTAVRMGGNPMSRYNWQLDTWNAANDWYFRNVASGMPDIGKDQFLADMKRHGASVTMTVPTLGWVAKDGTSYGFPVSVFGPQQAAAPEQPDAGNGLGRDGKPLRPGPPTMTSVRSTPETIEQWVRRIRERDSVRRVRSVDTYILDNEPALWNSTHRDVHPEPASYDELLEKTISYGSAIRRADPEARIAGPAEWGWLAYHYSAKDVVAGVGSKPDRLAHGDQPLLAWYLRQLRDYELRTKVKVLDILDVHFYPMGNGIRTGGNDGTDPDTNARRLRSTRSLWDPTYKDESWINERMQVLPLLRRWIAENYPGRGISIGEWDFGAEKHMSGGLAVAEVLGRFGTEGVTSAYRWGSPALNTPAFWAFRAYRNFDGGGARFEDWVVPVKGEGPLVSVFASRDATRRRVVAVVLNLAPLSPLLTDIGLQGCGTIARARGYTYTGGEAGFFALPLSPDKELVKARVPPYSITVMDLTIAGTEP
jgi:hypothetical protein